jgi:hypothetical protein
MKNKRKEYIYAVGYNLINNIGFRISREIHDYVRYEDFIDVNNKINGLTMYLYFSCYGIINEGIHNNVLDKL